eukprot:14177756-Ditylum_brightwellii.AAC.1
MLLVLLLTYVRCVHLCAIGTEPGLGVICHLAVVQAVMFASTWVSRLVSPRRASAGFYSLKPLPGPQRE